jgi:hypothetical protein
MNREAWTDERIDRLADIIENIAKGQGLLIQSLERITETQSRLADAQILITQHHPDAASAQAELAHTVAQLTQSMIQMKSMLLTTCAAVERLDRLMDYLLQRDLDHDRVKSLPLGGEQVTPLP